MRAYAVVDATVDGGNRSRLSVRKGRHDQEGGCQAAAMTQAMSGRRGQSRR